LPELPELFYDSLRQHKHLRHSVDRLANDLKGERAKQHQSRYLFGVGATLLLSGTAILLSRPEWDMFSAGLMAAGVVAWLVGWRRTN